MATSKRKNYPGNFERRGNTLRWRVCVGAERHRETFPTTNPKEAAKWARERYRELEKRVERKHQGLPGTVTMGALFDQFERDVLPTLSDGAQRSYHDSLKPLRTYFVDERRNLTVDKIRAAHVHAYLTWRRSRRVDGRPGNVSNRTLAKDRGVLHAVFALAARLEYRDGNPVATTKPLKSDPRTPVILSDKEYERLLESCAGRPMLALFVLTLGETGARCESEVLWLRWEDVDLKDGFLQIVSGRNGHRTKSGKSRWVPMTAQLRVAMRQHFAAFKFAKYPVGAADGAPSPWVFHHRHTKRTHHAGARVQSLAAAFKAAAGRAKLPDGLVQHDLRHTRVTRWLADGKNPVHVKEAVGHADLRMTMAYTHLVRENLLGLVDEPDREALRELA